MDDFLAQIRQAAESGLDYLALMGALALPDMCAGLESPNGLTSGKRYITWFDQWVAPKYTSQGSGVTLTGKDAYHFRCSVLHQGKTQHKDSRYERILFVPRTASGNVFHNNVLNDALNLDVPLFCEDVMEAATEWRTTVEGSAIYTRNLDRFVRVHPNGIAPYIVGVPVIS